MHSTMLFPGSRPILRPLFGPNSWNGTSGPEIGILHGWERDHEHTSDAKRKDQSIRHRVGEGTISFAEIASAWARRGVLGWAGGDAGAETGDGRGAKLFCERECEYLRRVSDESAGQRNDPIGPGGDGGFFQLRFE